MVFLDRLSDIYKLVIGILGFLTFYKTLYIVISFFLKSKKFPEPKEYKKYAVVIAARNEEAVIGQLIDSINKQTYDHSKITIFVVADNCTDNTATIAKDAGAIVYERFNDKERTKGFALKYLFEQIKVDYSIDFVDGYIVFDADNLLAPSFIEEINKAFQGNTSAVIGYRNVKNFDQNVISSAYGIHFFRSILGNHRPRGILGVSTNIQGTGYVIKSSFLKDGWHQTGLTEDVAYTNELISNNCVIQYCEAAEFFDEQPTDLRTVIKQRMRWTKGILIVFANSWLQLIKSFFKKPNFSKYDIFFYFFPYGLATFILGLIYQIITVLYSITHNIPIDYWSLLMVYRDYIVFTYATCLLMGTLACIKERKRIHCSKPKLILYILTWGWFDLISLPLSIVAVFKKVQWKPIKHKDTRTIDSLKKPS